MRNIQMQILLTGPYIALEILCSYRGWGWFSTTCLFIHCWRHSREKNLKRLQIQVFGFLGQLHGVEHQDYKIWGLESVLNDMKKAWDSNISREWNIHSRDVRDVAPSPSIFYTFGWMTGVWIFLGFHFPYLYYSW